MSTLRDHLQTIYDREGDLTPDLVVDEWRNPDHPMHDRLTWDDGQAAEAYRRVEAAKLIRSVRIRYVTEQGPKDLRAFVAVTRNDRLASSYTPTETALADPTQRKLLLAAMRREWQHLKAKYDHMTEFAELIRADLEAS